MPTEGSRAVGAAGASAGPLDGLRVIELGGMGPGPYGTMLLADLGADVVRIERPGRHPLATREQRGDSDVFGRGKRSVVLDLKRAEDLAAARALIARSDVLVDPYRPGVLERLGLAPDDLVSDHPRLVVARVTGWGQDGPLAQTAGHDINYLALAGALRAMGSSDRPPSPPLNLVADYGGGGMLLAFGVMTALYERARSGRGQVLDVAMVDGVASLMGVVCRELSAGRWSDDRGTNWLDGAAPWYRAYRTADDEFVTLGALEPQFYAVALERVGLDPQEWPQHSRTHWPALIERLDTVFGARTRGEWQAILEGTDACFAPALRVEEAAAHPHLAGRGTYVDRDGVLQPAPVPRFSRTPGAIRHSPPWRGEHTTEVLAEISGLRSEPETLS